MANVDTTNIKGRADLTAGTITKNYMLPAFNESGEMQGITISELEDNMAINNLTNISDGNLAIAEKGKRKIYRLGGWATNMPRAVNSTWCVEASNFNNQVIFQNAMLQSDASYYTRIGTSADGITWTWGNWEKLTTETDVKNILKCINVTTATDANALIGDVLFISQTYNVLGSSINLPVPKGGRITVLRTYFGTVNSQYLLQKYEKCTTDNDTETYERIGKSSDSGQTWTFGTWGKLTTETDILRTCVIQLDNISISAESYTTPRDIDISSLVSAQGVDVANSNFWGCCLINSSGATGIPIVKGASKFGFSVQLYNPTNKAITATYLQLAIYYKAK